MRKLSESMTKPVWRLLSTSASCAAENMAIDEAIVRAVAQGKVPPTLRFYTWLKPTVSLGYFQKHQVLDKAAMASRGVEWVRRLTGGRAVLHDRELTYSLVLSEDTPWLPRKVNEAYRVLSEGLVKGYRSLGLDATLMHMSDQVTKQDSSGAACFDAPSWYELVVDGMKVAGSAQTRLQGVLLQHGAILMESHAELLSEVFAASEKEKIAVRELLDQKASALWPIQEARGQKRISSKQLELAMIDGFSESLQIELQVSELTAGELASVRELVAEKYANETWNCRR